jgi:hypothetical protein
MCLPPRSEGAKPRKTLSSPFVAWRHYNIHARDVPVPKSRLHSSGPVGLAWLTSTHPLHLAARNVVVPATCHHAAMALLKSSAHIPLPSFTPWPLPPSSHAFTRRVKDTFYLAIKSPSALQSFNCLSLLSEPLSRPLEKGTSSPYTFHISAGPHRLSSLPPR